MSRVTFHREPGPPISMSKVRGPGVEATTVVVGANFRHTRSHEIAHFSEVCILLIEMSNYARKTPPNSPFGDSANLLRFGGLMLHDDPSESRNPDVGHDQNQSQCGPRVCKSRRDLTLVM